MGMREQYLITFKFGGTWVAVKNQDRRRYDGGKQRSVKIEKELICLASLREEIERICPWLHGYAFTMHYHIHGSSPKEYKILGRDVDARRMLDQFDGVGRAEIVVTTEEAAGGGMIAEEEELRGDQDMVECNDMDLLSQCGDGAPLSVGSRFDDASSFKHALRTQAITSNFGFKITKSDKKRVLASCSHQGCLWRIHAILCEHGHTFEVRKVVGSHSCLGVNRAGNRQATSAWVATEIQDVVKRHPDVPPKQLNHGLETSYGLSLPYMKLWRGREQAREKIFGLVDENYKWVPTLTAELLKRNPGSHITYTYDSDGSSFKRLFVSFKVCVDGFLGGCRYLIGLDAYHLKSKYLGVLLSANSLDGNNGLFTLAFAVVETESRSTWEWFMTNLSDSIGFDIHPIAFISDMEKGLAEAARHVFPNVEHRVCLRHLWKNLKKYFHCQEGQKVKSLVWTAANAYTTAEHDRKNALPKTCAPTSESTAGRVG